MHVSSMERTTKRDDKKRRQKETVVAATTLYVRKIDTLPAGVLWVLLCVVNELWVVVVVVVVVWDTAAVMHFSTSVCRR